MVFLVAAAVGVALFHIDARLTEKMNADLERERRLEDVARRVCRVCSPREPTSPHRYLRAIT